jgi:hypothetical protein
MKRRVFLLSGSASAALAMTGCGGGGEDLADASATDAGPLAAIKKKSTSPSPAPAPTTAPAPAPTTAPAPAPTTAPAPAPTSSVPGIAYPFGARLTRYAAGIKPTQSNATMDAVLGKQYDAWKAARVVSASSVVSGGYAVKFSDANYMTVSEGAGYGMLLTVLFAGYDANARSLFDGLLAVVRARSAYAVSQYDPNGKYLMDWRIAANGASAGDGWNAMDGDLDIAMALLMADRQWGSTGSWNYKQEALNTIAALKSWNMNADGSTKGLPSAVNNRTSDYMIGHFRAFKAATGDTLWDTAVTKAYALIDRMQTVYSAGVGLMPDFVINTNTSTPSPSTGYIGDGNDKEGYFWWNACRNPWRYSSDFLLSNDSRFSLVTGRMIDFFQKKSGGDPYQIGTGYALDGTQLTGGNSAAYHGPICAGACVDARFQTFLDTMWNWNVSHLTTGYYDSEIQLLSLVVASGNWWSTANGALSAAPAPSPAPAPAPAPSTAPAPAPAASGSNMLTNADFASSLSGWQNWGNSVVVGGLLQVGMGAGGVAQDIASKLTAGKAYNVTAQAALTAAGQGIFVGVKLMDAAGNVLVNQVQSTTSVVAANLSLTFTAPAGAVSGYVYVWKNADTVIGLVDNITLAAA